MELNSSCIHVFSTHSGVVHSFMLFGLCAGSSARRNGNTLTVSNLKRNGYVHVLLNVVHLLHGYEPPSHEESITTIRQKLSTLKLRRFQTENVEKVICPILRLIFAMYTKVKLNVTSLPLAKNYPGSLAIGYNWTSHDAILCTYTCNE